MHVAGCLAPAISPVEKKAFPGMLRSSDPPAEWSQLGENYRWSVWQTTSSPVNKLANGWRQHSPFPCKVLQHISSLSFSCPHVLDACSATYEKILVFLHVAEKTYLCPYAYVTGIGQNSSSFGSMPGLSPLHCFRGQEVRLFCSVLRSEGFWAPSLQEDTVSSSCEVVIKKFPKTYLVVTGIHLRDLIAGVQLER